MENKMKRVDSILGRLFDVISKAQEMIGILGLLGIMLMLTIQTVLQWFSISLLWSDEVVSAMNIWLVFMAATVVDHEGKHVQVTFITDKLPRKMQLLLDIVIGVICIAAFFVVFYGGLQYISKTQNIKTNILRLPSIALYTSPLIAIGLMIVMRAWNVVKNLFCLLTGVIIDKQGGGRV